MLRLEETIPDTPSGERTIAAFAARPVMIIAVLLGGLLLAVSDRYGYFGDELYFVAAGHHLSWGYVDQPPLVPLLALLSDTIAPGWLPLLRIPPLLTTVGGVFVIAATARELGGGRRAQVMAAAFYVVSPWVASGGHTLTTTSIDFFCWTTITWLLVRWIRLRDDRLLLWAGLATALALQAKYLVVFLWLIVGLAVLVAGPRAMLRSKMLWLGMGIAALSAVPSGIWQAAHGFPQLKMGDAISTEEFATVGGAGGFLTLFVLYCGLLGVPVAVYGLWRTIRLPQYRFIAITAVALVVVFIVTGGRPYYPCGIVPVLWAFGAVGLEGPRKRWVPWAAWPALVAAAAFMMTSMPIWPVSTFRTLGVAADFVDMGSIGWPQVTDSVEGAYRALPEQVREHTAVVGDSFWTASVIDHYGPRDGLPTPFSPSRGYWYFGAPPESATNVLYVGDNNADVVSRHFHKVAKVAVLDNKLGVNTLYQGAPIYLFSGKDAPWSTLWPEIETLTG